MTLSKANGKKEVLGLYLTTHPMEKYGFKPLNTFADGSYILQGGIIEEIKIFKDKNKHDMAFVNINTLFGNVKIHYFLINLD